MRSGHGISICPATKGSLSDDRGVRLNAAGPPGRNKEQQLGIGRRATHRDKAALAVRRLGD